MQSRASLYVSSNILSENLAKIRNLAKGCEVIPMVKADGYGHGAVAISKVLLENNVSILGVASLTEALELRKEFSSHRFEIYVFSDIQIESTELYSDFRITPVISQMADLKFFLSQKSYANFPLILKFNTGMNRLGFDVEKVEEISAIIRQSGRKSIDHVMSHFACSSQNITIAHNSRQIESFKKVLAELKASGLEVEATSLSNSGAIEQSTGFEYSHVRPGIMLYGPSSLVPGLESNWNGRVISTLKTRVLDTRILKRGDPVGYGLTPVAKDGLLIIAAIGYGDGFNNRYQKAKFDIKTSRAENVSVEVVGRVNMDMVQLLAPLDCKIRAKDELTFWDDDPCAMQKLCESSKTIPYEVLCQLSVRVPRIFTLT